MKKTIPLLLAALLLFSAAACGAKVKDAPKPAAETEPTKDPNIIVGRDEFYPFENTETIELTEEQKAIFESVLGQVIGVGYRPFACLGMQKMPKETIYCFLTQATGVYPDAQPTLMLVYVSVDNDGSATVINFADMPIVPNEDGTRPMTVTEAVTGGWFYAEDPDHRRDGASLL